MNLNNYTWQPISQSPKNGVLGTEPNTGEQFYIGRVSINGTNFVGSVDGKQGFCYIAIKEKVTRKSSFQLLVANSEEGN